MESGASVSSIERRLHALRSLRALRPLIPQNETQQPHQLESPGSDASETRLHQLVRCQRRVRQHLLQGGVPLLRPRLRIIDLKPFLRTRFVGKFVSDVSVPPVRQPDLLLKKMEAAKVEENTRRLEEETRRCKELLEQQERELKLKQEMEYRMKKQVVRDALLKSLMEHYDKFRTFHKEAQRSQKSLASQALSAVISRERRKRNQEDKLQRMRMKALKENDMEAYKKLVSETKNDRLETLLAQTDDYLHQLGAMAHQGESQERSTYDSFHNVVEEVTEQPNMMEFGTLKDYQVAGLQWLVSLYNNNLNGILADEMGLGKTIQTIALLCYLMEKKGDHGPFMVIVPLSTMSNWTKEFERWAPSVLLVEYMGKPPERKLLWKKFVSTRKFNVLLTTYDYVLNKHDRSKLESIQWHYIVVDEGHRMKNHKSKFTVALNTRYTSMHRLLLTGTPLQNNLSELWSLLNFLVPNIFNSSDNFDTWFNKPFENVGVENSDLVEEEKMVIINRLHQVLRPFLLRRLKVEVATSLPDKVERVVKCELSSWQKIVYKQVQNKFIPTLDASTGVISSRGLNNTFMQLRKICNHPYLFFDDMGYDWDNHRTSDEIYRCSGKFEILDRMLPKLQRSNHKVLMFTQMTRVLDIMEDYMDWRRFPYLRLDGQTKPETRSKLLDLFNAPESPYFLFLLSTRAGGLGLNLQSADTVVIFDSDWNPQMDLQAQDRAHRIGQQAEVRVFRLVTCSPVEEQILQRAQYKLGLDHAIIQAGKFNKTSTAHERKEMLTTILKSGVDMGEEIDAPDDDRLNRMLARTEDELDMFHEIDAETDRLRRVEWAKAHDSPCPSRLMREENEVPKFIRATAQPPKHMRENDPADLGRGRRRKGDTAVYTDVLSERQFCQLVEDGEDLEDAIRAKLLRRAQKELDEDDEDDEVEIDDEDGDEPVEDGDENDEEVAAAIAAEEEEDDEVERRKNEKRKRRRRDKKDKKQKAKATTPLSVCKRISGVLDSMFEALDGDVSYSEALASMRASVVARRYSSGAEFCHEFNALLLSASPSPEQLCVLSRLRTALIQRYTRAFGEEPELRELGVPVVAPVRLLRPAAAAAAAASVDSGSSDAWSDTAVERPHVKRQRL